MRMKKVSFISAILAILLVSTLTVGSIAVIAATSPTRDRLTALLDEAGVGVMPYELRDRLNPYDGFVPAWNIDPEVSAWMREQAAAGRFFLLSNPENLLADPEVYALIQAGAEWAEIVEFITERAIAQLQRDGRNVHMIGTGNVIFNSDAIFLRSLIDTNAEEFVDTPLGRILPVTDFGREYLSRLPLHPISDVLSDILAAQLESDNPFAPINIGQPFIPGGEFFNNGTPIIIRPNR